MTDPKTQVFNKALKQAYIDRDFIKITDIILENTDVRIAEFKPNLKSWLQEINSYSTKEGRVEGIPLLLACRKLVEKFDRELDISNLVYEVTEWEKKLDENAGRIDSLMKLHSQYISIQPSKMINAIFCLTKAALYIKFPFQESNINEFHKSFVKALTLISGESELQESPKLQDTEIPVNESETAIIDKLIGRMDFPEKHSQHLNFCTHIIYWLLGNEPKPEKTATVTFPYLLNNEGRIGVIKVELFESKKGNGKILSHPVMSPFFKFDEKAGETLKTIGDYITKIPNIGEKLKSHYITFQIMNKKVRTPLKNITDISFGAAFAASVVNLFVDSHIDLDCCISAGIDGEGNLLPVFGIPEKIESAKKAELRKFVLSKVDYEKVKKDYSGSDIRIISAGHINEVSENATGLTEEVENYLGHLEKNVKVLPRYYPVNYDFEKLAVNLILVEKGKDTSKERRTKSPLKFNWNDEIFYRNVILAEPGYGKTWLLKHLGLKLLKKLCIEMKEASHSLYDIDLPVFLRLGDIASKLDDSTGFADTLVDSMIEKSFFRKNESEFRVFIREKLKNNTLFLLFDALDEVDPKKKSLLMEKLGDFCRKHDRCPMIISSRKTGFQFPSEHYGFEEMEIQKLDDGQIREFIGNWFGSFQETHKDIESEESYPEKIFNEFQKINAVRDLARIPLFLSFICKFREDGELQTIRRRRDVFEKALWGLLTHWRYEKPRCEIDEREINYMLRVLESTAYRMFTGEREQIDEDILLDFIDDSIEQLTETFKDDKKKSIRIPRRFKQMLKEDELTDYLLDEFKKTGILIKSSAADNTTSTKSTNTNISTTTSTTIRSTSDYLFIHRSFLEYLTTSHIARKPDWLEELKQHFEDSRWEEVITMMAGFYDDTILEDGGKKAADAEKQTIPRRNKRDNNIEPVELVVEIIKKSTESEDEKTKFELLAGKCFVEWGEDYRKLPESGRLFRKHIEKMFETFQFICKNNCKEKKEEFIDNYVKVLSNIGDDFVVNYILQNNKDFTLSPECYRILGEMGTDNAIIALIELIKKKDRYDEYRINKKDRLNYLEKINLFEQMGMFFNSIASQPQFIMGEIVNWEESLTRLKHPKSEIEKLILLLMNDKVRHKINLFSPGKELDFDDKKEIVDGLNELLQSEELLKKGKFLIETFDEGKGLIDKGIKDLPYEDILNYNRLLLESIFPFEIARSSVESNLSRIDFELIIQLEKHIDNSKVKNLIESVIEKGGLLSWGISWFVNSLYHKNADEFFRYWITLLKKVDNLGKYLLLMPTSNNIYSIIPELLQLLYQNNTILKNRVSIVLAFFGIRAGKDFLLKSFTKGNICKVCDHDGEDRELNNIDYEIILDSLSQIQCNEISNILSDLLSGKSLGEGNDALRRKYRKSLLRCFITKEFTPQLEEVIADGIIEITVIRALSKVRNQEILKSIEIDDIKERFQSSCHNILSELLMDYFETALDEVYIRTTAENRLKNFRKLFYREIRPLNEDYGIYENESCYSIIRPFREIYDVINTILSGLSFKHDSLQHKLETTDLRTKHIQKGKNGDEDIEELSGKNVIKEFIETFLPKNYDFQNKITQFIPGNMMEINELSLTLLNRITGSEVIVEIQRILCDYENNSLDLLNECRKQISWSLASKLSLSKEHYPFLQKLVEALTKEKKEVRDFARHIYKIIR